MAKYRIGKGSVQFNWVLGELKVGHEPTIQLSHALADVMFELITSYPASITTAQIAEQIYKNFQPETKQNQIHKAVLRLREKLESSRLLVNTDMLGYVLKFYPKGKIVSVQRNWTCKEVIKLRKLYEVEKLPIEEIALELNRTVYAIKNQRDRLHLHREARNGRP